LKTSSILSQLGEAYLKDEEFSKAIKNIEHACVILSTLSVKKEHAAELIPLYKKLDELYLVLVNLYLQTEKTDECQSVIQTLEQRLEGIAGENDYAYSVMNELANILRQQENFELAAQFYKKALLCIKRRYKQDYLQQFGTSKVLVNLATVHYLLQNVPESFKYYNHALEVLTNIDK
jgi:tetratricopeptide (TPR) repeat protein